MDYITVVMGLLLPLICFHVFYTLERKLKKLPPGPTPLPVIGNLHLLTGEFHTTLTSLAKTYGPLMTLKLGSLTTVVVSSPTGAKEILQNQDLAFSGKFVNHALEALNHYQYSIVWLPVNQQWKALRKIVTTYMFTNSRLEANQHLRFKQVQELVAYLRKSGEKGEAVEVGKATFLTTLNLLANTIFSKDLVDYESDFGHEFKEAIWDVLLEGAKPNMADFFPVLKKIDPQGIKRRMVVAVTKLRDIFDELLNDRLEHRKLHGASNNDVLDMFLNYCDEHPDQISSKHITHTVLDIFVANDTTTNATEWAMAELLKNPEIMKKAKMELEDVIGRGKPVKEIDVPRLTYLNCIIKETLRLHAPVPFLFPRKPEKDEEVCGYTIPKGCQVLVNLWALGRDPNFWEDPLTFKPERFQESNIDFRGQNFEYLVFGSGRRSCPGYPFAVRMVPLMLGSLINSFDWKLEDGISPEELNMKEKAGIAIEMAHHLRAIPVPIS